MFTLLLACATPEPPAAEPPQTVRAAEPERARPAREQARRGEAREDDASQLVRKNIDAAAFPNAVCNDGSTPVFFFDRGEVADRWVIWFKGGGACSQEGACKERERSLTSAEPWSRLETLADLASNSGEGSASGILSSNAEINPDFHGWNHVYLPYCTSDDWAGARSASSETFGFHFRGHDVVTALFAALGDAGRVGEPTLSKASHVVIAGSSAGAAGVRNNVDRIAATLPKGVVVKAFSDAGITPAFTPRRVDGEEGTWRERLTLWHARADESCERAHPGPDRWKCLEGRTFVEDDHLDTPTFFRMDQRDPKVIGEPGRDDPEQARLAREASAEIRTLMGRLPAGYSPANGFHIVLNDPRFARERTEGHSAAEIFGNWYFDRPGPKLVVAGEGDEAGRPGPGKRGPNRP